MPSSIISQLSFISGGGRRVVRHYANKSRLHFPTFPQFPNAHFLRHSLQRKTIISSQAPFLKVGLPSISASSSETPVRYPSLRRHVQKPFRDAVSTSPQSSLSQRKLSLGRDQPPTWQASGPFLNPGWPNMPGLQALRCYYTDTSFHLSPLLRCYFCSFDWLKAELHVRLRRTSSVP